MTRTIVAAVVLTAALPHAAGAVDYDPAEVAARRSEFVDRMVEEHDFEREALEPLLGEAKILDSVLEAISRPAERVVPWHEYRGIFLNDARIAAGADFRAEHAELVAATAEAHGVDERILLAILGVETLFGQRMGSYRVLDSLATLAFAYPPRAAFFRSELESFLLLARAEGDSFLDATGSYAGAMGAGQFIPTSYTAYAVDGDADGRRDLWGNWHDVLASVANYLAVHGWRAGEPVAVRATRPEDWQGPEPDNRLELDSTVGALRELGYEFTTPLADSAPAAVFALEAGESAREYWIGFNNFHVITRYNRSHKYALAVHELGDAIGAAYAASTEQVAP